MDSVRPTWCATASCVRRAELVFRSTVMTTFEAVKS
jgi:hypothetical protein